LSAVPLERIPVGVVVERRKATSPWIDYVWRPISVLAGAPATAPWTVLDAQQDVTTFYAGTADIELFRTETGNYRDNLTSGQPSLWVVLRVQEGEPPYRLFVVTADPAEGEAFTEAGNDLIEAVPMPDTIAERLEAFVAQHHVERPMFKRKRDRYDPGKAGRRAADED
jgi:hypothetical protein